MFNSEQEKFWALTYADDYIKKQSIRFATRCRGMAKNSRKNGRHLSLFEMRMQHRTQYGFARPGLAGGEAVDHRDLRAGIQTRDLCASF